MIHLLAQGNQGDNLSAIVADAKANGVSTRSVEDIFTQAKEIARACGALRE